MNHEQVLLELEKLLKDSPIKNEIIAIVHEAEIEVEAVYRWEEAIQKIIGRKPEAGLHTKALGEALANLANKLANKIKDKV